MSSIAFLVSSIMLSVPAVFRPSFAPQNNSFMESFDQIWCDVFSFHPAILEVLPGLLSPTHQILSTESYSFYLSRQHTHCRRFSIDVAMSTAKFVDPGFPVMVEAPPWGLFVLIPEDPASAACTPPASIHQSHD